MLKRTWEVKWWKFEGIKLRLADRTFLTIDFAVLNAQDVLEMHDVKGHKNIITDDALAKTKIAADMYPFVFKFVYPDKSGWVIEQVGR
jgi:hypothetical protein